MPSAPAQGNMPSQAAKEDQGSALSFPSVASPAAPAALRVPDRLCFPPLSVGFAVVHWQFLTPGTCLRPGQADGRRIK